MSITSPADFLKELDAEFFQHYRQLPEFEFAPVDYCEPDLLSNLTIGNSEQGKRVEPDETNPAKKLDTISSKVVTLPDFIDTDAVSPESPRPRISD
jgi:hypothetical protein